MPSQKRSYISREANTHAIRRAITSKSATTRNAHTLEYGWLCWADVVQISSTVPTWAKDETKIWKNYQYQYSQQIPEDVSLHDEVAFCPCIVLAFILRPVVSYRRPLSPRPVVFCTLSLLSTQRLLIQDWPCHYQTCFL